MSLSDHSQSGVLQLLLKSNDFPKPTTVAVALTHTPVQQSQTGASIDEVANSNAYARVDLGAPSNADWSSITVGGPGGSGTMTNANNITFPQATGDWGWVSGVALVDNSTHGAGSVIWYGRLTTPREILNNDTFQISAGNLAAYIF